MMRALVFLLMLVPSVATAGLLDFLPLGWLEKRMLYVFSSLQEQPRDVGLRGVTVTNVAAKGASLVVWSAPPRQKGGPVVLYFHGNAGNLGIRANRFQRFQDEGFGFVAAGYRGSSGSTGRPSETALTADALLVYAQVRDLVPSAGRVIVFGESLGTAVTTALMDALPLDARPAGVILEAPFTSIPDMARAVTDVPPDLIARIKDTWDTKGRATALTSPLLVVHGALDPVVPIAMGRAVFQAAATSEKDFRTVRNAGHVDTWTPQTRARMWRFIRAYGG